MLTVVKTGYWIKDLVRWGSMYIGVVNVVQNLEKIRDIEVVWCLVKLFQKCMLLWNGGVKSIKNRKGKVMSKLTNEEIYFAETVIGVIDHVQCPMLMYDGEKQIVKKALMELLEKDDSEE